MAPSGSDGSDIKRRRTCQPSFWDGAVDWVRSRGGFIHPALHFQPGNRELLITTSISQGTTLMRIPSDCLITLSTIESSNVGKDLFYIVNEVDDSEIYNEKNDLLLAIFLSIVMSESDNSDETLKGVHLYLKTLPSEESYDGLPRRWTNEEIDRLLIGTSAYERTIQDKKGLEKDYNALKISFAENKQSSHIENIKFPEYDCFDQMIAAISSRAFGGLGTVGDQVVDAMIPLLDLMNHKRGTKEKSDISYTRLEDGTIEVKAKSGLDKNQCPGITYGAKGNSQLLTRYGFCLRDNIEPDGKNILILSFFQGF
jgi:hypothetical protein